MIPEDIKKKAYEKYPVKMGVWYDLYGNAEEEDTNEVARNAYAAGMLTERERLMKEIQKNTIEDGYIARDERGRLVYSNRKLEREWDPERSDGGWYPDDDIEGFDGMLCLPDKWFPEVRWADLPKKAKLIILKEDEPKPVRVIIEEIKEVGK